MGIVKQSIGVNVRVRVKLFIVHRVSTSGHEM